MLRISVTANDYDIFPDNDRIGAVITSDQITVRIAKIGIQLAIFFKAKLSTSNTPFTKTS